MSFTPTNPYEPPQDESEPAKKDLPAVLTDWLAALVVLVIVAGIFYTALPTIQKYNRMIDPPRPAQRNGNP